MRVWKVDLFSSIKEDVVLTDAEDAVLEIGISEIRPYKMSAFTKALKETFSLWFVRQAVASLLNKGILFSYGNAKATRYALKLSPEQSAAENVRVFKYIEDYEMGYRQQ